MCIKDRPGGGTCTETINDPAVDCVDLKKSVCQACEGGGCLYNNNEKFCYGRDSGDIACHVEVFAVGKYICLLSPYDAADGPV